MKICRSMYLYVLIGLLLLCCLCIVGSAAISYTPSSGSLASTTSLNNGFVEQLYTADKAGALALRTSTNTANDTGPVAHTYKFEPADYLMLGGSNNDFYATVAGWDATLVNLTVRLYGTDWYGAAQYEDLYFTGNGVLYATLLYRTSNSSMVMKCYKTGAFSVSVVVSQGQWGRMWKTGINQYRIVNCTPVLTGYYNQTNTSISFYPASSTLINFGTAGHCIFGNLSSTGVARWGCHFINEKNINTTMATVAAATYMKFYACSFMSYPFNRTSSSLRISATLGPVDIRNCVFSQNSQVFSGGTNSIFKRNTFVSALGSIANTLGTTGIIDDQFFDNVSIPISMGTSAITANNCTVNNYDYLFKWTPIGLTPIIHKLRNFKVLGNLKALYLGTATGAVKVILQYGIQIRTRNETVNLSGVSVKYYLVNASSLVKTLVSSGVSGSDGVVPYVYLNRSIWLKTNLYPSTNYSVYVIVAKSGYQTTRLNFTMSRELIFDVVLIKNYTSGLVVAENIVDASGTHEYAWYPLLGLHGEWWVWANYTGTASGGGSSGLLVDNPNPANGTFLTNFLMARSSGLTTAVDISGNSNFTVLTEANLGSGVQSEHLVDGIDVSNGDLKHLFAQTITIGTTGTGYDIVLKNISFYIYSSVTMDSLMICRISLLNDSGFPTDNYISVGSVEVPMFTSGWHNVNMSPCVLYSGHSYAIVLTSNNTVNDMSWAGMFPFNQYIGGSAFYYVGVPLYRWYYSVDPIVQIDFSFNVSGWSIGNTGNITWDHTLNQTWSSNSSGAWLPYAHTIAVSNSTQSVLNTNFSDSDTVYYYRVATSNSTGVELSNITVTFSTAQRRQIVPMSTSDRLTMGLAVGLMFGGVGLFFVGGKRRRKKDVSYSGRV